MNLYNSGLIEDTASSKRWSLYKKARVTKFLKILTSPKHLIMMRQCKTGDAHSLVRTTYHC